MPVYRYSKQYYYLPGAQSTIFLTSYLYLHSIFYLSLYLSRIYLCICLSKSVLDVKAWAKSKVSVSGGEGRIDKGRVKKYVFCLFLDAKDLYNRPLCLPSLVRSFVRLYLSWITSRPLYIGSSNHYSRTYGMSNNSCTIVSYKLQQLIGPWLWDTLYVLCFIQVVLQEAT